MARELEEGCLTKGPAFVSCLLFKSSPSSNRPGTPDPWQGCAEGVTVVLGVRPLLSRLLWTPTCSLEAPAEHPSAPSGEAWLTPAARPFPGAPVTHAPPLTRALGGLYGSCSPVPGWVLARGSKPHGRAHPDSADAAFIMQQNSAPSTCPVSCGTVCHLKGNNVKSKDGDPRGLSESGLDPCGLPVPRPLPLRGLLAVKLEVPSLFPDPCSARSQSPVEALSAPLSISTEAPRLLLSASGRMGTPRPLCQGPGQSTVMAAPSHPCSDPTGRHPPPPPPSPAPPPPPGLPAVPLSVSCHGPARHTAQGVGLPEAECRGPGPGAGLSRWGA